MENISNLSLGPGNQRSSERISEMSGRVKTNSPRIKTDYPGVFYRESKRREHKRRKIEQLENGQQTEPEIEKVYYIVFKKDGKVFEEKAGRQFEDKMTPAMAARIRLERIDGKRLSRKEIREAAKAQKTPWTIERLWDEYRRQRPDLKSLKPDENRFDKYIKPDFGHKEPYEIAPLDTDRLRLRMLKDKSPQTVKLTLALLRRICNFGHNKRLCNPLPFMLELPKVHNIKTEDLNNKQLAALFAVIDEAPYLPAGQMMKLALFTGMRRGEMFKLKWKDIDFDRQFIKIRDPKGGRDQSIPMSKAARGLLGSIEKTRSPFVFPGPNGKQRKDIKGQLNKIKTKAGLPEDFRPLHGLRHTYASMLASSGKVDLYTLQKLLTHRDPKMTQRYAHLRDEALKKAGEVAGDIISRAVKEEKQTNTKGSDQPTVQNQLEKRKNQKGRAKKVK